MDSDGARRQRNLTKKDRTTPSAKFLQFNCLREHFFDIATMDQDNPQEIQDTWLYVEDAGIENIMDRAYQTYHPRLVRLFYQSLRKAGPNYVFTWDGIDYHLTEELIGRALHIATERPANSGLKAYDDDILIHHNIDNIDELPNGLPKNVLLLDRILFVNAWSYGDYSHRSGKMLETTLNVMQGNWISPAKLIFKSMKKTASRAQTTDDIHRLTLPLTIEAIRMQVGHYVFEDEDSISGMITCGRDWGKNFYEDAWNNASPTLVMEEDLPNLE